MVRELPIIFLCAILSFPSCQSSPKQPHTISGAYSSNASDPDKSEFQERGNCAYEVEGRVRVLPSTLAELDFTKELPSIHTKEYGWIFVRRDGSTIPTMAIDNGPDNFSEGLARYIDDDKIGFIDASGTIVIKAQFRFAAPFEGGFSRVCNECVKEMSGEYVTTKSSHWGCINKNGELVLQMKYSMEDISTQMHKLKDG